MCVYDVCVWEWCVCVYKYVWVCAACVCTLCGYVYDMCMCEYLTVCVVCVWVSECVCELYVCVVCVVCMCVWVVYMSVYWMCVFVVYMYSVYVVHMYVYCVYVCVLVRCGVVGRLWCWGQRTTLSVCVSAIVFHLAWHRVSCLALWMLRHLALEPPEVFLFQLP